jgi:gas vesicle protein
MSNTMDSLKKDAADIGNAAENILGVTKGGVLDAATKIAHIYTAVRSIGMDDMLSKVGLARERTMFGSTARFAGGFALGVGAGLMFAPSSGKSLRARLAQSISKAFAPAVDKVEHAAHKVEATAEHLGHNVAAGAASLQHDASKKVEEFGHAVNKVTTELASSMDGVSPAAPNPNKNHSR